MPGVGGVDRCPAAAKTPAELMPPPTFGPSRRDFLLRSGTQPAHDLATGARTVEGLQARPKPDYVVKARQVLSAGMTIASSASGFPPALVLAPSTARLLV